MSIESLMTTANAAGYVMAAEDELPEGFGRKPSIFDFKALPATSLAIWRPLTPAIDGRTQVSRQASHAWGWFAGRFMPGATA
jgi:hypothetical protein